MTTPEDTCALVYDEKTGEIDEAQLEKCQDESWSSSTSILGGDDHSY